MHLVLYKYSGERNRVNKTSLLTQVLATEGSFKGDVSLLSPTLLLSLPQEPRTLIDSLNNEIDEVITSTEVLNFNYFYIKEFRRFYYVSSLVVSSNNLVTLTGEVDPLNSFQSEILANSAFVERNEFNYDVLQEDNLIPLELTKTVTENVVAQGSLVNCSFQTTFDNDPDYKNIVCTFVNVAGAGKTITFPGILPNIDTTKFSDACGNLCLAMDQANAITLVTELLGQYSSYATFFKGLVAYPINLKSFSDFPDLTNVTIYKEDLTSHEYAPEVLSAKGAGIPNNSPYFIVADFTLPALSNFLDLNPYAHYEIYLPFYGYYELNINQIGAHRLIVYYSATLESGAAEVYIFDYTAGRLIFSSSVQLGIPISLPSTNAQEIQAQKNAAQLNLILGLVGSGVGLIGSAVSGNVLGAVGSGLSAVGDITGYINQTSLLFQRAQTTHNGTAGGLYAPLAVRLKVTRTLMRTGLVLSDFAHQVGRPLRQVQTLSTLSGFTKCGSVHLEGCTATQTEKDSIVSSLLSGVIL